MMSRLAALLDPKGFDLVHPFEVNGFNEAVEPQYRLPDFDRADALGILIGNSRALWHPFMDALKKDPDLLDHPHPIQAYTERAVSEVVDLLGEAHEIRWAHDAGTRLVPMQRLAHLSGLAHLGPGGLNVHSVFGPWIALRAVVTFDQPGPHTGPAPCPAPDPCKACKAPCVDALAHAVEVTQSLDRAGVAESWREWLTVRDVCPEGRDHRYSETQIRYHYEKDKSLLRKA